MKLYSFADTGIPLKSEGPTTNVLSRVLNTTIYRNYAWLLKQGRVVIELGFLNEAWYIDQTNT